MTATAFFDDDRALAIDRVHAATALYTATPIVDALLDKLGWPNGQRRLVDPSCGDGAFLARALVRLLASGSTDLELIEGWEFHPQAAADARERVVATLCDHGWHLRDAQAAAGAMVINRDFLTQGPLVPTYDVIAGNPPYLRAANIPTLLRVEYAQTVPDYARADMLHAFLDRCATVLREDGIIGLIASDRFLINANCARLRTHLGKSFAIAHLARIDEASAFYRPKNRKMGTPPRIHPIEIVLRHNDQLGRKLSALPIYPDVVDETDGAIPTLERIAAVRLAPWLGAEGIFVVRQDRSQHLPTELLVPAVDTDDITLNDQLSTPYRYAIRTDRGNLSVDVRDHLEAHRHLVSPRGLRKFASYQPPEAWGDFPLDRPSLLIPRIANRLRVVRLPAGILPINHNLSIIESTTIPLNLIERALRSSTVQRWIRERAPRLENGFMSITPRLLRDLPIDIEATEEDDYAIRPN